MALAIDSAPAVSSLAPGFRFHPTDEELVRYYLRRKVCGKPFRFDAISDVDVYKVEPWDLPGLSRLKTRDLEWYFFSVLDKKYGNGSRTNRATDKGYWKTTGKDRAVHHRSQQVGMKKTLVYHSGRAPKGERTNWVMHEYRLIDQELKKAGIVQDAFVLCRIFHKSGSGPKNGEKYGAPFLEEEWEDDELVFIPKEEDCTVELPVDDDSYLDVTDIELILGTDMPDQDSTLQANNINPVDEATNDDPQNFLVGADENGPQADKTEYTGEPSSTVNFDVDYLLDEPYFDATNGDLTLDESLFFEANDLENTLNTDSGIDIIDEYTSFFNSDIENFPYGFDSIGNENENVIHNSSLTLENANEGTQQASEPSRPSKGQNDDIALSSTDITYPFLKKASYMLGNISAPPAFASEFPTKFQASTSRASSSVHIGAGMIHISNVSFSGGAVDFSLGKHAQLNIVLSFGSANSHQVVKANSGVYRGWFYCVLLWILVLSLSLKIGSFVCPRSFMS